MKLLLTSGRPKWALHPEVTNRVNNTTVARGGSYPLDDMCAYCCRHLVRFSRCVPTGARRGPIVINICNSVIVTPMVLELTGNKQTRWFRGCAAVSRLVGNGSAVADYLVFYEETLRDADSTLAQNMNRLDTTPTFDYGCD
jgi:hypothetical protein